MSVPTVPLSGSSSAPPERVYVVTGCNDGSVHVWAEHVWGAQAIELAVAYHHVLVGANLDAEIYPVPEHAWEAHFRPLVRAELRARGLKLIEHPRPDSTDSTDSTDTPEETSTDG